MQTAREFLFAMYGESAAHIRGIDFEPLANITVDGMALASTEHGLQTSCGGIVLIWLTRGHSIDKRPMAIVYDTSEETAGNNRRERAQVKARHNKEGMTADDWSDFHKPAPHPFLRLTRTA